MVAHHKPELVPALQPLAEYLERCQQVRVWAGVGVEQVPVDHKVCVGRIQ